MITGLIGSNSLLLRRRLSQLVDEFLKDQNDLALEKIDATEAEYEQISDALSSMPFLATRKMVVLRELSANKQAVERIEQLISSVSSTTDVIIVEPNIDKRTVYSKVLNEQTTLEQFDELDPPALAKWLSDEAKKLGGELSLRDANYLVERLGPNQMMLATELDKLLISTSHIARETIDALTEPNPQSKIFDLLDAMFAGNKAKALALYNDQRAQKVEPQAILALIVWQLQLLALAKLGEGKTSAQIAKESKTSPYPLAKAQSLAKKMSKAKLQEMIDQALSIDYRSKTVGIDLNEALKTYISAL